MRIDHVNVKKYEELDITLLDEHPENPRLFYRDAVVESIVHEIKLKGKEVLSDDNAISVTPRNGRYVIYKGHHRYLAAKKAGLDKVYCWVDTDITDEDVFIELLLDNNQAELSPLERGKHAFTHTEKYSHDGKSVSKYAERIGQAQSRISQLKSAYEVYEHCSKSIKHLILSKLTAYHFQLIHSAPSDYWLLLVQSALKYHWTTDDLELRVKSIKDVLTIPKVLNKWLVLKKIIDEVLKDPKLGEKYKRLGEVAKECYDKMSKEITLYDIKNEYKENEEAEEFIYHLQIEFVDRLKKKKTSKIKDIRKIYGGILGFIDEKEKHYSDFLKRVADKKERERQDREREKVLLELQQRYEPDIYNQDCLAMTDEQVADDSVDLILTDPPYGLSNDGFTFHGGEEISVNKGEWDKDLPPLKDWIDLCARKLKPGGNLFICATYHNLFETGYEIQKHKDLKMIQYIGWQSKNPAPIFMEDRFKYVFELVIFARKTGDTPYFDRDAIKKTQEGEEEKQMGNYWVLDIPHGKERIQNTQKPEELSNRIIKCACPKDGLILDLFAGGATFLVSAKKNSRRSIGFEKDEATYKDAVDRIENTTVDLGE